jgi:hypothetical protein
MSDDEGRLQKLKGATKSELAASEYSAFFPTLRSQKVRAWVMVRRLGGQAIRGAVRKTATGGRMIYLSQGACLRLVAISFVLLVGH